MPKISKTPFILADVALLALAGWIIYNAPKPLDLQFVAVVALCVFGGAVLSVLPFLREFQGVLKLAEHDRLADTLSQIKTLERSAAAISNATAQWQHVQDIASKTVSSCQEIGDRMTAEAKAFAEFMQKANDTEKAHLRLEVEKLRRGEGEWLQILIHLLDHVYALYQAGVRSGQPQLETQLSNFQKACREVVRRIGLVPVASENGSPYDATLHLLPREEDPIPENPQIVETLAPGYRFQGQLLRKAIVRVESNGHGELDPGLKKVEQEAAAPAEPEKKPSEMEQQLFNQ